MGPVLLVATATKIRPTNSGMIGGLFDDAHSRLKMTRGRSRAQRTAGRLKRQTEEASKIDLDSIHLCSGFTDFFWEGISPKCQVLRKRTAAVW